MHSIYMCQWRIQDFLRGGRAPIRGDVVLRRGHFPVKMYAKTKELGPIGGGVRPARPPRSSNVCGMYHIQTYTINSVSFTIDNLWQEIVLITVHKINYNICSYIIKQPF